LDSVFDDSTRHLDFLERFEISIGKIVWFYGRSRDQDSSIPKTSLYKIYINRLQIDLKFKVISDVDFGDVTSVIFVSVCSGCGILGLWFHLIWCVTLYVKFLGY